MLKVVEFNSRRYGKKEEIARILEAMEKVDRRYFVLDQYKDDAYEDIPLPIERGQTISQPSTVARMLLMAKIKKGMSILEVGSGSGWNACLLAYLSYPGKVISVERIPELAEFAHENLHRLKVKTGIKTVDVAFFERSIFSHKNLAKMKFDLIVVTAAGEKELIGRLKKFNFSRLIFPTREGTLESWTKKGKNAVLEEKEHGYAFVPLVEK